MTNTQALLVFDVDGTLLQTHTVTVPAVQRTFAAFGLAPPAADAICSFFGRSVNDYETWLKSLCPPDIAEHVLAQTNALELDCLVREGRLYAGVPEMLETLSQEGHTLAICSNGPESYVQTFLSAHALAHRFSAVYARGNRYSGKTEMVGLILRSFVNRPLVCIGDRHDDIDAAHAWGGYAVAAAYGYGGAGERSHADATATEVRDIPGRINQLIGRRRIEK